MSTHTRRLVTHYDNLKVARNAPSEVIRAAFKALSQKHHPDLNKDDPDATRRMQLINEAYRVLSDPEARRRHDAWIAQEESSSGAGDIGSARASSNDESPRQAAPQPQGEQRRSEARASSQRPDPSPATRIRRWIPYPGLVLTAFLLSTLGTMAYQFATDPRFRGSIHQGKSASELWTNETAPNPPVEPEATPCTPGRDFELAWEISESITDPDRLERIQRRLVTEEHLAPDDVAELIRKVEDSPLTYSDWEKAHCVEGGPRMPIDPR